MSQKAESVVRPEAKAAAAWWAKWLRQVPYHDASTPGDGPEDKAGVGRINLVSMSESLGLAPLTQARIEHFEATLATYFHHLFAVGSDHVPGVCSWHGGFGDKPWCDHDRRDLFHPAGRLLIVDVDYDPHFPLNAAAEVVGFDPKLRFPLKATMWIRPGRVIARRSSGEEEEMLYVSSDQNAN